MTKQEQIEYLQVACDAEDAVYTCEKAIEALEAKINTIFPPEYPPEPTPVKYKDLPTAVDLHDFDLSLSGFDSRLSQYKNQYHIIAKIISILIGIVSLTLLLVFNPPSTNILIFLVWLFLPVALTFITWKVSDKIADHKRWKDYDNQVYLLYADKRQADKDRYNKESQQFHKQLKAYDQGCQLTRDAKSKLAQEVERLRAQVRTLDAQRQQVYALGILHERFHNSLAVHQLREYFDMGVCDSLEGASGAIAQFLMDIRANRICGSIDELRTAVETGMQAIISNQGHILREVRETNNRITSMGQALSTQLQFMQSNILSAQYATQTKMEACMEEATKHLDSIGTTLKDAAHNEYIAMKAAKVEGYLNLHRIS